MSEEEYTHRRFWDGDWEYQVKMMTRDLKIFGCCFQNKECGTRIDPRKVVLNEKIDKNNKNRV